MAYRSTLCFTLILSILLLISITESSRCSKNYSFQAWQLNSSIPSDLNLTSNSSNDTNNQICLVKFLIDFTTGLANGSFTTVNQSSEPRNELEIITMFSLSGSLKNVIITYQCSMSDYCDIEFVRETLSPTLATFQIERIRQELATRLYNSSNTGPVKCFNNISCPQNTSICHSTYLRRHGIYDGKGNAESICTNLVGNEPVFTWTQVYTPFFLYGMIDYTEFYCNIPNCGSNNTVNETVQWLSREYVLPLNISILNVTTTTVRTTTTTSYTTSTTSATTKSTTTSSDASHLFGHMNNIFLCFVFIVFWH